MTRCIHGFERPELSCGPCRDRIARGQPLELEHRARTPKPAHEDPVRLIEVVDDAAVHRGRAPTTEEIREAAKESPDLPPIEPDDEEQEEERLEAKKVKCGECGAPKPLTEEFFYKSSSCKSGFSTSKCKECRKKHEAAAKAERSKERAKKYTTLPAKESAPAPGSPPGVSLIQDLQAVVDERVSDIRKLHMAMLTIRKIYGLECEIKIPSLVG